MTEYLTDHEASLPAIMLGCVAEISQSVPASIGKGIPLQKAENEGAGAADASAGSPPERRIRPMTLGTLRRSLCNGGRRPPAAVARKDVLLLPTVCRGVEWDEDVIS
jgi:hypothetical protein